MEILEKPEPYVAPEAAPRSEASHLGFAILHLVLGMITLPLLPLVFFLGDNPSSSTVSILVLFSQMSLFFLPVAFLISSVALFVHYFRGTKGGGRIETLVYVIGPWSLAAVWGVIFIVG